MLTRMQWAGCRAGRSMIDSTACGALLPNQRLRKAAGARARKQRPPQLIWTSHPGPQKVKSSAMMAQIMGASVQEYQPQKDMNSS